MASRHKTFLIRATLGNNKKELREGIMRLPVDQYGGITYKGHQLIGQRFYDGITGQSGRMQYALCLEAYTTGENLQKALVDYQNNTI